MQWIYLSIAIASEIFGTTCLKLAEGFTRPWPSVGVVLGYAVTFLFLSLTLETMPVGVAYAVWAGIGIAAMAVIGWVKFGQPLDAAALVGMALIVAGVVILNGFSRSIAR
jgi:small multidrug resistance pump